MSSVRVFSLDWNAVRRRLSDWAAELVREVPDALGVLLFGSLARDEHVPGSDADLIVVVRSSSQPPGERVMGLPRLRAGIPADIAVYTVQELEARLAEGLPFLRRALREGRWLAVAPGWEPPRAGAKDRS